jgi:hypothetical protein
MSSANGHDNWPAAETSVLGALLIGASYVEIAPILSAEHFTRPDARLIYQAIGVLAAAGTAVDVLTVQRQLEESAHLQAAGGLAQLSELARTTPTRENAAVYARVVRKDADCQRLRQLVQEHDGDELLDGAERILTARAALAAPGKGTDIELRAFTAEEALAEIASERFLLPGIPAEAYTLIAGALSSYKTTLLLYLLVWKATGWDLLGLDEHGNGIDMGRCVLASYEDTDARIFAKLQRVIQSGHRQIAERWSRRDADHFVERAAENIRRVPLMGKTGCGIVCRSDGIIVPNLDFLDGFLDKVRQFAPGGATIGLDPLRLALSGSQSDDDGADVAVHTMNAAATRIPGSGLIVCSHATKAGANDPGTGYTSAAYATSGSALYSQHARSNFLMARLKEAEVRELFDPTQVTAAEAQKQLVVRLTHGRLSHGIERGDVYLVMREGVLLRLAPKIAPESAAEVMQAAAVPIIAAIDRIRKSGVRVSADALGKDGALGKAVGGRDKIRDALTLLCQNSYVEATGTTRDRDYSVTPKGRTILAEDAGESPRESQNRSDS